MTEQHDATACAARLDAVLFASYGTSREEARAASIELVARDLREAYPAPAIFAEAYTSAKARRVLARRGTPVPDVSEALHDLARRGARRVLVQPGHLLYGDAFSQVERAVRACAFLFERIELGAPLLADDADAAAVARALDEACPAQPGEALVFAGHGAEASHAGAGSVYATLALHLRARGRSDAFVGSMREFPRLDDVRALLAGARREGGSPLERVRLVPLMLTAAAHAARDIAGAQPGSWASSLTEDGFSVETELVGLGALPAIRDLYVAHARAAWTTGAAPVRATTAVLQETAAQGDAPTTQGTAEAAQVAAEATQEVENPLRFPVFVSLCGKTCLVVGAGTVGYRRARALARFGAHVVAVDPAPRPADAGCLRSEGIELRERAWSPVDLAGTDLVVASTGDRAVNAEVAAASTARGIPVSVADDAAASTFFFPAIAASGHLVAGIVSDGANHQLTARAAARVREVLREVDDGFE